MSFTATLRRYSDPTIAQNNAYAYLGKHAVLYQSNRKNKKYMIYNPDAQKWIHFGQIGYTDFTKHQNQERRLDYLRRTSKIKGDWRKDPYSPNNLSRNILW